MMPLPFSKLVFMCSEPIHIPKDADDEAIERYRQQVEQGMLELTERVEAFFTKRVAQVDFQRP